MDYKWAQNKLKMQQAIATVKTSGQEYSEEAVKAEYVKHLGVVIDIPVVEKPVEKVEKKVKKAVKGKKK